MKVVSITIKGFKSFADTTVIDVHQHVNAIVGPNGCGKSNIVEAVLWVLGEQSVKELRGSKMEDVIFSGSKERKSAHYSEVQILFDNSDRILPFEYAQVEIARKLFRNGESEYSINRVPVRMKDIHELFSSSGLSKNSFAIIGQGKVDEFIRQSPLERRRMFDEVSGIARFFMKRKEAIKKLEASQINVDRISDLVQELEKQREKLQVQVDAARNWTEQQMHCILSEMRFKKAKSTKNQNAVEIIQHQLEQFETENLLLKKEIGEEEQKKAHIQEELKVVEHLLERVKEKFHAIQLKNTVYEGELKRLQEAQTTVTQRIKNIEDTKSLNKKKTEGERSELSQKTLDWDELSKKKEKSKKNFDEIQVELAVEEKKCTAREKENQEVQEKYRAETQLLNSMQLEENYLLQQKKEKNQRIEKTQEKQRVCSEECIKISKEENFLAKKEIDSLKNEIDEKKKLFHEVSVLVKEEGAYLKKDEETIGRTKSKIEAYMAQKEAYSSILKNYSENNEVLHKFFSDIGCYGLKKQGKENYLPPSGTRPQLLSDFFGKKLIQKSQEFLRFLDTHYSSTLVLSTFEDLLWIQKIASKRTITCLTCFVIDSENAEDFLDVIEEKVSIDVQKALNSSFFETSKKMKKAFFVSDSWEVDAIGMIRLYCSHNQEKKPINSVQQPQSTGRFSLEKEIASIESELVSLIELQKEEEKLYHERKKRFHDLLKQKTDVNETMRKLDMNLVRATFQMSQMEEKKKQLQVSLREFEHELQTLKSEYTILEKRLVQIEADKKARQKTIDVLLISKKEKEKQLQESCSCIEGYNKTSREIIEAIHAIDKTIEEYERKKVRAQALEEERRIYEESLEKEMKKLLEDQKALINKKEQIQSDYKKIQNDLIHVQEEVRVSTEEIQNKKKLFQACYSLIQQKEKKKKSYDDRIQACRNELVKAQAQYEMIIQEYNLFYKSYEKELSSFSEKDFEMTVISDRELHTLEKEVEEKKKWLQLHKDMNFQAEGELSQILERLELLQKEFTDLTHGKEALLRLINDLEDQSRLEFMAAFDSIRAQFKNNFVTLFGGGEADLKIIGADSILDSGVELKASPPGKEMRSLHLLSGGERCLTALALLFAIFQVKKAPLCLLDEVDAPLDEANVVRFHRLLQKTAEHNTQFLVVTHNKRTMTSASRLIGVSMKEKGVSCILSVETQSAPHQVAAEVLA